MRALPSCLRMVAPKAPLSLASRLISSGRALRKAPLSVLARGLSNIAGEGHFVGIRPGAKLVPECKILSPERDFPQFDSFSLLTEAGEPREGAALPLIEDSKLQRMYRAMVQLQEIDVVFMAAHRQGPRVAVPDARPRGAAQTGVGPHHDAVHRRGQFPRQALEGRVAVGGLHRHRRRVGSKEVAFDVHLYYYYYLR